MHALATASTDRCRQISAAWKKDMAGCGWPPADFGIPEIADMREWLERHTHRPGKFDGSIDPRDVEMFNAELLEWDATHEPDMLEQDREDNATRTAWVERRIAEREHNAEVSGYNREIKAGEILWHKLDELDDLIVDTAAASAAGALAKLAHALAMLRLDHGARIGETVEDIDDMSVRAVCKAIDDMERLSVLPGLVVAS
jgi:hypothetical protein